MRESRPPVPPFTRETAVRRCRPPRMPGIPAIHERVSRRTPLIRIWRNRDLQSSPGARDRRVPDAEVGTRTRLRAAQEPVGLPRQSHRRAVPVRMARRAGQWYRSYGNELWEFDAGG